MINLYLNINLFLWNNDNSLDYISFEKEKIIDFQLYIINKRIQNIKI